MVSSINNTVINQQKERKKEIKIQILNEFNKIRINYNLECLIIILLKIVPDYEVPTISNQTVAAVMMPAK